MATTLPAPRTVGPRRNLEKYGWIYMRASGVVLIVLIFGHLFINLVAGQGVKQIDFAFIAGKYATITNDYVTNPTANRLLKGAILVAVVLLILLGTLVITTFDPCPSNAAPGTLPSFCSALTR